MTTTLTPQTYRSSALSSIGLVLVAIVLIVVACYAWPGATMPADNYIHHSYNPGPGFSILLLAGACFALYCAVPYAILFDQPSQRYEYRWGVGPLAMAWAGNYADIDCVYVRQHTQVNDRRDFWGTWQQSWQTTYDVKVQWATARRNVSIAWPRSIQEAELAAREISAATGVAFGGIYDDWNNMWIEGPFHQQIGPSGAVDTTANSMNALDLSNVDPTLGRNDSAGAYVASAGPYAPIGQQFAPPPHSMPQSAAMPAQRTSPDPAPDATHPLGVAEEPHALGDDAGLNDESGMWK